MPQMETHFELLPPAQALKFWESRVVVTAAEFAGLTAEAKQRAFTVSGLSRLELVQEMHSSLYKAMESGQSLQAWKQEAKLLLSGEAIALKGHRLDTIFRTNVQGAYQAGRYAQMRQTIETRPLWRYSAVMDNRTRPAHAALHGAVYPANDAFWASYYPPLGFNCRCTVTTLSERQAKQRGYEIKEGQPGPTTIADPATGKPMTVTPVPDPGFGGNPGRDWLRGLSPRQLDEALTPVACKTLCKDGKGLFAAGDPCAPALAKIDPRHLLPIKPGDILPAGRKPEAYVQAFLNEFGISSLNGSAVQVIPGGAPVVISKELFIEKATGAWKVEKEGRERYVKLLARTIKNPYEVWLVPAKISGRNVETLRLLRLFAGANGLLGGFAVFHYTGREWSGSTVFAPKLGKDVDLMLEYLEKQRQGTLQYRAP